MSSISFRRSRKNRTKTICTSLETWWSVLSRKECVPRQWRLQPCFFSLFWSWNLRKRKTWLAGFLHIWCPPEFCGRLAQKLVVVARKNGRQRLLKKIFSWTWLDLIFLFLRSLESWTRLKSFSYLSEIKTYQDGGILRNVSFDLHCQFSLRRKFKIASFYPKLMVPQTWDLCTNAGLFWI